MKLNASKTKTMIVLRSSTMHPQSPPFAIGRTVLNESDDLVIRWWKIGGFQEQGQFIFIGLSCSIPTIVVYSFSLSLLSVYRLVLYDWGLRTDRAYITLSQPCTADLF